MNPCIARSPAERRPGVVITTTEHPAAMSLDTNPPTPPLDPGTPLTPPPAPTPPLGMPEKDVRMWSMLCHLAALAGLVVPSVGAVVGPLVIWLLKRQDHPTIDAHGKSALNFQISVFIYSWALGIMGFLTSFIFIGFLILPLAVLVGILAFVFAIIAAVKVSNGENYTYPFTIRFLA